MPKRFTLGTTLCAMCSAMVDLDTATDWAREQFRRTTRAYCSAECGNAYRAKRSSETMAATNRKYASKRMKANNPMRNPASRLSLSKTLREIGHRPPVRGGNGTGLSLPQSVLMDQIGGEIAGWKAEMPVLTGKSRQSGYPPVYKLDLAHPGFMIGIEVDGRSHGLLSRKEQDQKKEVLLSGLGWTVLRFKNAEILENPAACAQTVLSITSKWKELTPTSLTAS